MHHFVNNKNNTLSFQCHSHHHTMFSQPPLQPSDDTEVFRQLREGRTLFGSGWRCVDNFEEVDDDLEDDDEEVSGTCLALYCSCGSFDQPHPLYTHSAGIRRHGSWDGDGLAHAADRSDVPAHRG